MEEDFGDVVIEQPPTHEVMVDVVVKTLVKVTPLDVYELVTGQTVVMTVVLLVTVALGLVTE